MILLFTSAITSVFAECRRELERLNGQDLVEQARQVDPRFCIKDFYG